MPSENQELDRRDFMKKGAHATAGVVAAGLGLNAALARVPLDKTIQFTDALPTRVLGRTKVGLPILGYGGAALPRKWGNTLSTADRVKLVRHAYDSGIRYFDTAISYTYSDSQEITGRGLKEVRDNVFITTKVDFWNTDRSDGRIIKVRKGEATRQVEMNLRELKTDYIDAILIHGTPGVEQMTVDQCMEVQAELAKARDRGLVRFVGFSAHHYFGKALALIETNEFDLCMLAYGYIGRGNARLFAPGTIEQRDACVARAHELGMGIVAMKVLGAGMLGGFGRKDLENLPAAACRYVAQDERIHMLTIGMRTPAEVNANVKTLAEDITCNSEDHALLAAASAAVLNDKNVKKMPVE